jgi:voltage-gated potassium channel
MVNLKRAQYTLIFIVVVFYVASIMISIFAGIGPKLAFIDNTLDSLQVNYSLLQFASASNPLILFSKLLDAVIFPILTVVLAAWFFDFINNINLRERLMLSKVNKLEGHVIVVPYNSFAKSVLEELKSAGIKAVTITQNKREMIGLYKEGELAIDGDLRSVETFDIARINKAKYVIACGKDDIENAMISITAKTANPYVQIISRVNKEENLTRLESAGAHKTVLTDSTAGADMGNEIVKRLISKKSFKNN